MIETSAECLAESGPLAKKLDSYRPRAAQGIMASAIEKNLQTGGALVCEAGTGVGKTFAYLIPALLQDKKIIISTGTKTLQDQLFHRDLPFIRSILANGKKFALLKGRANYLCLYKYETIAADGTLLTRQELQALQHVHTWREQTESGDIAECQKVSEDATIWQAVTSTADNCLGTDCPRIKDCLVVQARKKAMEADVIVINHHLLFADQSLKEEGFGELLPACQGIILDEAHQIPEIAAHFLGESLSSRQLHILLQDILLEQSQEAEDMAQLPELCQEVSAQLKVCRTKMGDDNPRGIWQDYQHNQAVERAFSELRDLLQALYEVLEVAAERSKGLANCCERALELKLRLERLSDFKSPVDMIHWYETHPRSFLLSFTPLSVANAFQSFMKSGPQTWIFTSATITVQDDFEHYQRQLGLSKETQSLALASPFNYPEQALLYQPRGMPDPGHASYLQACCQAAIPVIEAAKGRTFFLFTSHYALQAAAEILTEELDATLLVQGEAGRNELLRQFKQTPNSVLLGTNSFWEGIDIPGSELSCVIIDKLPFASPGDPVISTRIKTYRNQGIDPFAQYQLPKAVILLKQGVGRLIRSETDQGVLMICDPRLNARQYGGIFLESLPPFQRTRDKAKALAFLSKIV